MRLPVPRRPQQTWKNANSVSSSPSPSLSPPPPPSPVVSSGMIGSDFFAVQSNSYGVDFVKPDIETVSHGSSFF